MYILNLKASFLPVKTSSFNTLTSGIQNYDRKLDRMIQCIVLAVWLPPTSTSCPPDVIHVTNAHRPPSFFAMYYCERKQRRPGNEMITIKDTRSISPSTTIGDPIIKPITNKSWWLREGPYLSQVLLLHCLCTKQSFTALVIGTLNHCKLGHNYQRECLHCG